MAKHTPLGEADGNAMKQLITEEDMRTPRQRTFLTADWRYLLMLNYRIDPTLAAPLIPKGTEIDLYEGEAYASVVGFLFLRTRVLGLPIPLHTNFEEVNLRLYVRRKGPEGWRRGVVFVKEIVPRRAIAAVARLLFNENYVAMPMHHFAVVGSGPSDRRDVVEYGWRRGDQWGLVRAEPRGDPMYPIAGSVEEFIAEHYWGYSQQRDGGTIEYGVEHPPWRVWQAVRPTLDADVGSLYGRHYEEPLAGEPASAFVAEGSPVVVRRGSRIVQ